jgi:asparagine synthase (glutamine-hydrolysing)
MVVSDMEVQVHRRWDVNRAARRDVRSMPREQLEREILQRLTTAVERRMVADVPFGAFLSGGIDSSAVVGLMSRIGSAPVHTFSVVFDEEEFSEEQYALQVARKFGTTHDTLRLTANDMLEAVPDVLAAMDHPSGDGANTWLVSRATRRAGITMALSGLGGDELFAGYPVFKHVLTLWERRWLTQFPTWMRGIARRALMRMKPEFARSAWADALLLDSFTVDSTYPLGRLLVTDRNLRKLVDLRELPPSNVRTIMHRIIREEGGHDLPFLSQVSVGELSTYLPNVLLRDTDQMSMAHALEVRVPFLDHELVEFVLGISDREKFPHSPKQLLVSALGDLLPPEIVHRPKMGFVLPWEKWMRNELRELCSQRISSLGERPLFRRGVLVQLWKRFLAEDPAVGWYRIWSLVVLEDFIQRHGLEDPRR